MARPTAGGSSWRRPASAGARSRTSSDQRRRPLRSRRGRSRGAPAPQGCVGGRRHARASRAHRAPEPARQRHRHARRRARAGRRRRAPTRRLPAASAVGPLHGLPVAHKDLVDTAGIRTTRGSLFYKDHVPTRDAVIVTRMRAAGAVTIGKTNTPEFGAGSQTFNRVFGPTRNPWDVEQDAAAAAAAARPWRWRAAWCRSPMAATPAARCAIRRPGAMSWGSGRHRDASRAARAGRPRSRRADGAHRGGRRAAAQRPRRPRHRRSAVAAGGPAALSRRPGSGVQGHARRVVDRARRPAVRAGDSRDRRWHATRVRAAWLRGRGRRARFRRRRSGLPGAPLRLELHAVQGAARSAAGMGEGHDRVRGRAGRGHGRPRRSLAP